MYAGQSRNITLASIGNPHSPSGWSLPDGRRRASARQGWAPSHPAPVREGTLAESERRAARLIHRACRGYALPLETPGEGEHRFLLAEVPDADGQDGAVRRDLIAEPPDVSLAGRP